MTVSGTTTKTGLRIRDVGVVAVPVTDQDRALEFYVGKLGFDVRVDAPMPTGGRWIMLSLPSATTAIALVAATEHSPTGRELGIRFTTTDAEADHADMVAAGVDVDEVLHWPGVPPMFKFRDLDGNALEIVGAF
jgi:catechol 2,3-dioxygenase-like lactoylglutathione lyase family enzyme